MKTNKKLLESSLNAVIAPSKVVGMPFLRLKSPLKRTSVESASFFSSPVNFTEADPSMENPGIDLTTAWRLPPTSCFSLLLCLECLKKK